MGGTRTNWNEGQEFTYEDLNSIAPRFSKIIFDRLFYEIMQRQEDGFFNDSFKVIYSTATSALVKKGVGFQNFSSPGGEEPSNWPVYMDSDTQVNFTAPNPTNPRIDIVVAKTEIVDGDTEQRKFKNASTGDITNENFVVSKDYEATLLVVEGTPGVSPSAPSVPAGYVKLAEAYIHANSGMANQDDVTDSRNLFPLLGPPTSTGTNEYDAVVGDTGDFGITHETLRDALLAAGAGWKILVTRSETIDTTPEVNAANVEIVFKRGVTLTKGTATIGLQIDADDCKVVNGRFLNFTEGVRISTGSDRTMLRDQRYNNCTSDYVDNGTKSSITGGIKE